MRPTRDLPRALLALLLLASAAVAGPLDREARSAAVIDREDSDEAMGRRLQEALRAPRRGGDIYRCYSEALDRDPSTQGELLVELTLGPEGRVARAVVLKDQVKDQKDHTGTTGIGACLTRAMGAWRLAELGAEPGERVVFPLVFRPDQINQVNQVNQAAPPAAPGPGGGDVEIAPASSSRWLTLIEVAPGDAGWSAQHPGELALLYVLAGRGRAEAGAAVQEVSSGDGVLVPLGVPYRLRGALRVLRFLVRGAPGAPGELGRLRGTVYPQPGGQKAQVRILLDVERSSAASLAELRFPAGSQVPLHQHEHSDEIIYIVSGRGLMSAGARSDLPVGAGDVVRVPKGLPHALRVQQDLVAVQSYQPAGPEGRFRRVHRDPEKEAKKP